MSQSLLLNKPMQLADSQSSLVSAISTHDEDNDAMGDDMESTDSTYVYVCGYCPIPVFTSYLRLMPILVVDGN